MPAVSDTSVILGLSAIDQLKLLHDQFGAVFMPQAVLKELKIDTKFRGTSAIRKALKDGWLEPKDVQNLPLVQALSMELDLGEAEALALASDLKMGIVLIDEHDGRKRARAMGIKPVGAVGILLRAKADGKIPSVKDCLTDMKREIGFFIAEDFYQQILKQAGER